MNYYVWPLKNGCYELTADVDCVIAAGSREAVIAAGRLLTDGAKLHFPRIEEHVRRDVLEMEDKFMSEHIDKAAKDAEMSRDLMRTLGALHERALTMKVSK